MKKPTREEILNMDYLEVNKPVGVFVMGLPDMEFDADTKCPYCQSEMRYCGSRSWCSECGEWITSAYKDYGYDISAAWEVVEKLGNWHGFDFLIKKEINDSLYCAGWFEWYGDDYESRAACCAKTVSLAICRAALLAVLG